jgi:hypothetical protein
MKAAWSWRFGQSAVLAFLAAMFFSMVMSSAHGQGVPIPVEEQIKVFQALPAAQQQSLIRELQRNLPPAQRQSILEALQGQGATGEKVDLDRDTASAFGEALDVQTAAGAENKKNDAPRLKPHDTIVTQFEPREETSGATSRSADEQRQLDEFRDRL